MAVLALATACAKPSGRQSADAKEAYSPGLGEIMSATQMRHLKLWYAGQAENWQLASYELDELEEGFADAIRFHPEHKQSPRPLTELVPEFTAGPIATLRAAIAKEHPAAFVAAYDALTQGCNACHVATQFSFNVVTRPAGNPYSNQSFGAER
ncbi:MAG: hypothetical protein NTZ61_18195 [Proteobacteria bacterium]|nr:hypothetical protein [Pseudomonadota bacterium]